MSHEPKWFVGPLALTYFGPVVIFLLLLLNSAEVNERLVVAPEEFQIAFPKVMGWIQETLLEYQRLTRCALPVPAVYPYPFFAVDGGLIAYGADSVDFYPQVAAYVDRILKGTRPADLPVEQPAKFELVINLKTAKAFGLTMPATVLATANGVIE
jgi:ABC transporter substrate binding protein